MARNILLLLLLSTATAQAQPYSNDFASHVNPMIGTGGHGHTYPGALVPFGMMQLSPDTRLDGWDGCSGYHYSDSIIYGFSHTHLSGTGCSDYGDILLMPASNPSYLDDYGYASRFSHDSEVALAGYYSVFLDGPRVKAELTSGKRAGMHRYTFAERSGSRGQWLVLNLRHRDEVLAAHYRKVDSVTLRGYRFSKAWAAKQKVFFEIRFSKPLAGSTTATDSLVTGLHFKDDGKPLLVKVAISAVSEEGAHKNMLAEMPDWNFDGYRKKAHAAWNGELSKLDAKGGTPEQQIIFYTALYHCMSAPNIYSDVDGRYRGRDDKIHSTGGKFDYYTVFSLWDTYRAEHPLLALIDPKRTSDFINTFIRQYEEGGRLPVWELSANETDCMIGYHAVSVIWDAYSKGIRGFDAHKALEAMKHSAMLRHYGLESYDKYGFVRADDETESVSKTLEYAYDDWCIAQMAAALGKKETYYQFMCRSQSWRNVYDPTTGFMRARKNGTLYTPFSPYAVDGNYTEANAWQYSFYVPHDVEGLMEAMGGLKKFEAALDALFSAKPQTEGREQADITGLIGQYAHGNEPSHHIAYLYNYVGKPEKTRAIVKHVMDSFYHNAPDGLIGNEDCGQMSAWYVMSAMGIYPVCPGMGKNYEAGRMIFDSVIVTCSQGHTFSVKAAPHNDPHVSRDAPVAFFAHDSVQQQFFVSDGNAFMIPITAAPFIYDAKPIFKDSETIAIGALGQSDIFFWTNRSSDVKQYYAPFRIKQSTILHFYSIRAGFAEDSSTIQEARFTKLPDDRNIILHSTYNKSYSAGGPDALIDGQHGTTNWRTGGWQGYQGQDVEATVALKGAPRAVLRISATFLEDQNAWIFYPKSVSFYASGDSLHWQLLETVLTGGGDHNPAVTTATFSTKKAVTAKYIKVVAKSFGKMPQWHEGRGEQTFIFIDEIELK